MAIHEMGDCAMADVIPSKLAGANRAEKNAWRRYAAAKDDNWREAFGKWVEARDASLATWANEITSR
jgi:hypothetical protein